MTRINAVLALVAIGGAVSMVAFTNEALAHTGDVHHWFEHQRALSDGGPMVVDEPRPLKQAEMSDGRARLAEPVLSSGQGMKDCLPEQARGSQGLSAQADCDSAATRSRSDRQAGRPK